MMYGHLCEPRTMPGTHIQELKSRQADRIEAGRFLIRLNPSPSPTCHFREVCQRIDCKTGKCTRRAFLVSLISTHPPDGALSRTRCGRVLDPNVAKPPS